MEVSSLGFKLELQLPVTATATAMRDPSCLYDLHHSSRQCPIRNPLIEARDRTCSLRDTSQILSPLSCSWNTQLYFNFFKIVLKIKYFGGGRSSCIVQGTIFSILWWGSCCDSAGKRPNIDPVRMRVRSLALLSGLRICHCQKLWHKSQRQLGSGVAVAVE